MSPRDAGRRGLRSSAAVRHGLATTTCGSGPPVLLVHGFAGFKESWGSLPEAIASGGRAAVAVDLPGWGESPAPRRAPHSAAWYATRLAPLLDDLGPAIVIGHSLGAQAAVRVAVRRPDLVRGLLLVSPQVVRRAQTGWRPRVPSDWAALPLVGPLAIRLLVGVLARDDARLVKGFTVTVADPDRWRDDPAALALLADATRRFRATDARVWSRALHRGLRTDLRRAARGLRVPTTILTGEQDRIEAPEAVRRRTSSPRAARSPTHRSRVGRPPRRPRAVRGGAPASQLELVRPTGSRRSSRTIDDIARNSCPTATGRSVDARGSRRVELPARTRGGETDADVDLARGCRGPTRGSTASMSEDASRGPMNRRGARPDRARQPRRPFGGPVERCQAAVGPGRERRGGGVRRGRARAPRRRSAAAPLPIARRASR